MASAFECWRTGQKEYDADLFKTKGAPMPSYFIFGDVWGKNYPVEKRLLDHIIHYIRTLSPGGTIGSCMVSKEKIVVDKGLNFRYDSELISAEEKAIVDAYLFKKGINKEYVLEISDSMTAGESLKLAKKIRARQNEIRRIKSTLKKITSSRIEACFAPYKGAQRRKMAKVPVKDLVLRIKHSDFYRAFNPTLCFELFENIAPLSWSSRIGPDEENTLLGAKTASGQGLLNWGIASALIDSIFSRYDEYLRDMRIEE
jgi:hypothetical protein